MTKEVEIPKLETYLKKACNPSNDDLDISSVDAIVNSLKSHPELSYDFTKIMIPLFRSANSKEALFCLEALEELMDSMLPDLQVEVNKFKFLNELIRLVSKKYDGNQTPKEIKDRILDILFTWTDKYPDLTKIKDSYEMLKTQGIIHEPMKNVIAHKKHEEHKDSTLKLMESEKFKRLLQSKNPLDIRAANLMIQNMVRDSDRRLQLQSRRLIEVKRAHENSILLQEMLENYNPGEQDEDTMNIMKEIFSNCEKLMPTIARLAEESQDNEKFLEEILETSDSLNAAMEMYRNVIIEKKPVSASTTNKPVRKPETNSNLLDISGSKSSEKPTSSGNGIDELSDIFSNINNFNNSNISSTEKIIESNDILAPEVVERPSTSNPVDIMSLIQPSVASNLNNDSKNSNFDLLQDFDLNIKTNPIVIKKSAPVEPDKAFSRLADIDSLVSGMKNVMLSATSPTNDDDKILGDFDDSSKEVAKIDSPKKENIVIEKKIEKVIEDVAEVKTQTVIEPVKKSLAELEIDIDNIEPSDEPPRVLLDEVKGLKVMLNFAKDRPRDDVLVIVITVMNQGPQVIKNFHFDSSVAKPCKLRLFQPSCTELPAVKGWKPPTELITQVLLLSNPTGNAINSILCILTYCLGDDPDPVKDSIEVKDIPYICQ